MKQNEEEPFRVKLARLKARRDAIRKGVRNPRPARTPLSVSWSRKSKPRKEAA
jgi:hypothetical protein